MENSARTCPLKSTELAMELLVTVCALLVAVAVPEAVVVVEVLSDFSWNQFAATGLSSPVELRNRGRGKLTRFHTSDRFRGKYGS